MTSDTEKRPTPFDEAEITALYRRLLESWNVRDADGFAASFAEDGVSVGFDGSEMAGRGEIASTLRGIFADHVTGTYVGKVRGITALGADVALLRAVSGLIPAGASDLNPALNASQVLIAVRRNGDWCIALYQNTPAQYHGRPEAVEALTDELRQAR